MTVPAAETGRYWAETRRLPVIGTAWGVPLVAEGRVVRNAGGGATPGVVIDPAGAPPSPDLDGDVLVLHDLIDLEGRSDVVQRAFTGVRRVLRYEARACHFGGDPAAFVARHLSSNRRRRLRADRERLEDQGQVTVEWLEASAAAAEVERFQYLLDMRAADTSHWDAAVSRRDMVASMWRELAGGEMGVSVLRLNGRALSFRAGFVAGPWFVEQMPAVDRRVSGVTLGEVHMRALLDQLAELGVTHHLMGKGSNQLKEAWGDTSYSMWGVVVPLRRGPRALYRRTAETTRQRLRRLITATGVEPFLRRILHVGHMAFSPGYRRAVRRIRREAQ